MLPPQYPLRPPSFRFLTPSGRFEVNREICLSISGHHEETWQPAWGIRTALVAMRSFMDTDARGQLGGLECGREVRERMAKEGAGWRCGVCGKTNAEILREREEACKEGERGGEQEEVPRELRLAYRDELGGKAEGAQDKGKGKASEALGSSSTQASGSGVASAPVNASPLRPTRTVQPGPVPQLVQQSPDQSLAWIDTCIYGVVAALLFMVLRKFL